MSTIETAYRYPSNFITDFFSPPLRSTSSSSVEHPPKDTFDHFCSYVASSAGAWDIARVVEYAAIVWIATGASELLLKIKEVANRSGIALSVPKIFIECDNFRTGCHMLYNAYQIDPAEDYRSRAVAQAYKKCFYEGSNVVGTLSQAALFLQEVDIYQLGRHLPGVKIVYNASSMFNDTVDILSDGMQIYAYNHTQAATDVENREIEERRNLTWMKLAKNIPSVVSSTLSLLAVLFASFNAPWVGTAILGLDIAWLSMRITSNVYERAIAYNQSRRLISV